MHLPRRHRHALSVSSEFLAKEEVAEPTIVGTGSLVRPKIVTSVHYCPAKEHFVSREYKDALSSADGMTSMVRIR